MLDLACKEDVVLAHACSDSRYRPQEHGSHQIVQPLARTLREHTGSQVTCTVGFLVVSTIANIWGPRNRTHYAGDCASRHSLETPMLGRGRQRTRACTFQSKLAVRSGKKGLVACEAALNIKNG